MIGKSSFHTMTKKQDMRLAMALLLDSGSKQPSEARLVPVSGGMSGATVIRAIERGRPPRYVKIARGRYAAALRDEIARTRWLAARGIAVPHIVCTEDRADCVAMLMHAAPGSPIDDSRLPSSRIAAALGAALAALHAVPADDCPFDETLATRLARAAAAVAKGEIDGDDFDDRNSGVAPDVLLARLGAALPAEDIVVVHGDATLDNVMIDTGGGVSFIDCGNAGRGDRYLDLAVMASGIAEHFGADAVKDFARAYGGAWDGVKARYYLDLYELF